MPALAWARDRAPPRDLLGGRVTADSAGEGQGATFEVRLPLRADLPRELGDPARASDSDAAPELGATSPESDSRKRLTDFHVLVVDDQPDARDLVATVLADAGARVTQAESVAEALRILAAERVGILVSDIGMPGEDGYTLIQRVRSSRGAFGAQDLPAIALTAFARAEDRQRALAAGFHEHLAKPIDPVRLVDAVAGLVNR